jgi:hypothetical protein
MYVCSGKPMHFYSGVDTNEIVIFTCRVLQHSLAAISSIVAAPRLDISESQSRRRAIAVMSTQTPPSAPSQLRVVS